MRAVWLAVALVGSLGAWAPASALAGDSSRTADRDGPIGRGNDQDAAPLLGRAPPALPALTWLDGRARSLASLRGQVVVIRSFTEGCPFCASSMPALEQWHRQLGPRGLTVLGVYHPKPPRATTIADAAAAARKLNVSFAVANDPDWSLVNAWWLGPTAGSWTSFTYVLDRGGRVRYVHPGGEFHAGGGKDHARCRADHGQMQRLLESLLAEPKSS